MKKNIFFTLIIGLFLTLGACSNSFDKDLIGDWDVTSDSGDAGTMNVKENNTMIIKFSIFEESLNYEIDNEEALFIVTDSNDEEDIYEIEENDNGFTLTQISDEDGENEVLTLTESN